MGNVSNVSEKTSRATPCSERIAGRLELYGGAASRDGVKEGDLVDVCVDGHGYHWVLVTKISRVEREVAAEASSPSPAPTPLPEATPVAARPQTKAEAISARISARNAAKNKKIAEIKKSKELGKGIPLSERVYEGLLTNDPAPACLGCVVGRRFTFGHRSIKELKRGARGVTVPQAVRNLRRFLEDSKGRSRKSADYEAICMEMGIVPTSTAFNRYGIDEELLLANDEFD